MGREPTIGSCPPPAERGGIVTHGAAATEAMGHARTARVDLDTLFWPPPVAWRGTRIQYAGRLHRWIATSAASVSSTTSIETGRCFSARARTAAWPSGYRLRRRAKTRSATTPPEVVIEHDTDVDDVVSPRRAGMFSWG